MDTPSGQVPQPFQQEPDAPPTVVSVSGPNDIEGTSERDGRLEPRRFVAAGLATLALVLTLAGCFLPLFSTEHRIGFDDSEKTVIVIVQDAWESAVIQDSGPALTMTSTPLGVPLLVAAVTLLAAAVITGLAVRLRRPGSLDRWAVTIAAVFLAGAVASDAMLGFAHQFEGPQEMSTTVEAGMWALFAAVVAAVGATVMSHRVDDDRIPVSDSPSLADLPTPKHGISITVLPAEPQTQAPPDYSAFAPPPAPGQTERD